MAGLRIGAVNSAIEEMLEKLREMNEVCNDAEIEVAFLEFSSGAKWLTPNGPFKVENYYWSGLDAGGSVDMGEAFRMLEEKLRKNSGFMISLSRSYAPIIFLLSNADPTDDYKTHLVKLKDNSWFRRSTKIALPIGDEANETILEEFTGHKEAVVRISSDNAGQKLAKMIRFIEIDDEVCLISCRYCGVLFGSDERCRCFSSRVHGEITEDNALWKALRRVRNECGEDIFLSLGKFRSALADFFTGIGQDVVRQRKRTVEAVELGVYKRLKEAEQSDLERVTRVEIKRLQDEGINEATAREITYTFAKFFVQKCRTRQEQIELAINMVPQDDDGWEIGGNGCVSW